MKLSKEQQVAFLKSLTDAGVSAEEAQKALDKAMATDKVEEVVLDSAAQAEIAKQVASGLGSTITDEVEKEVTKRLETLEKSVNKNVKGGNASEEKEVSKEVAFMRAVSALKTGNAETLKDYNAKAIEARSKAGYANETIDPEGGYVVMLPEFEAEIEKLVPNYGVALREATVRFINSNSVLTNKRGSNVQLFEISSEGGAKPGTKMTISQQEVTLREFAAIAIATNRLVEDAAIDFWAEVTEGFAEAYAQKIDEMAFTENGTVYKGIIHTPGVQVNTVGATISLITWDDLLDAEALVPEGARSNMKHFMHRTVWNIIVKGKDSQNRYQWLPSMGNQTPWGTPVVLSDSMPSSSSAPDANEGYVITGDLKRLKIYTKRGLVLERSNEATVQDADGNTINLWQRNMQALKAEFRAITLVKFPEAFVVTGTGTVS